VMIQEGRLVVDCNCTGHNGFLTAKGLQEVAQRELKLNALDAMGIRPYLDKSGSVSALVEVEDLYEFVTDDMTDQQYWRFHNGS